MISIFTEALTSKRRSVRRKGEVPCAQTGRWVFLLLDLKLLY